MAFHPELDELHHPEVVQDRHQRGEHDDSREHLREEEEPERALGRRRQVGARQPLRHGGDPPRLPDGHRVLDE